MENLLEHIDQIQSQFQYQFQHHYLEMFEHIPTPITIPKSPPYDSMVFSSLTYVGGAIKTLGGAASVYPIPD